MTRRFQHIYANGDKVTLDVKIGEDGVSIVANPEAVAPEHQDEYVIWRQHVVDEIHRTATPEESIAFTAWGMATWITALFDQMVAEQDGQEPPPLVAPTKKPKPRKRTKRDDSS